MVFARALIAALVLVTLLSGTAFAACTGPAAPAGRIEYTSAAGEQVFKYCNGTDWVAWAGEPVTGAAAPSSSLNLNDLGDVTTSGVSAGEVLLFSGGNWVPGTGAGGGALNDLSDAITDYATLDNIFIGDGAGNASTPGIHNVALGVNALASLDGTCGTAGDCDQNTAIGYNAGSALTTGHSNTFTGAQAGRLTDTGASNAFFGIWAGYDNTSGSSNTFIGKDSGQNNQDGSSNTFIGRNAGTENIDGWYNTAVGRSALEGFQSTGSAYNVALGYNALKGTGTSTGVRNVAIGSMAGDSIGAGSDNILIGHNVDASAAGASNELNIGNTIYGDLSSDYIGIGDTNPSVALDVAGDINYTGVIVDVSDIRLKDNVRPLDNALLKLSTLNGFAFEMKDDPKHQTEYGVSAQDVREVFPELVHPVDAQGNLGVNYSGLIAPMIEAIKELKSENESLRARLEQLENRQPVRPANPYNR